MVSRFRERLTFANVASSIALFAALSTGGAYAADKIGSKDIAKKAVKSKHIKNAQVKGKDIAADAIDSSKVGDGSLLGVDFAAGQLPQGPQGPQGPKGDTGATGPQGPQGAPGASELERRHVTSPSDSNGFKLVVVNCPAGKKVVGSAGAIGSGNGGVVLDDILPSADLESIVVRAVEITGGYSSNWTVTGYAICAKVS